jgi:predicted ATP-grasp superfamily ATP-dependent carboligase
VAALVLKVGDYVIHHGGLAVTRTLGRVGVPVHGVHEDRFAPAGLSRYTTGRVVWPTAGQHDYQAQLLDGIADVAARIRRPTVLIPTDDHAAMFVCDQADLLRRWFLFPSQSPELIRTLTDKASLHERCRQLGVSAPAGRVATTTRDLEDYAVSGLFPVVAKRSAPWLLTDGRRAQSTQIVRSADELLAVDVSSPVVLQEHIPAACAEDWLFHGYCDERSDCLVAFTGRKLRSFPPGAGETSLGRSEANPALEEQARALFKALDYRGVMSLDYRFDRRDGRYKLLDFNPRTGAIFRLFETASGVDVVRALHLDLTGRRVPPGSPVAGRVVAVEGYDVRSCRAQRGDGGSTVRDCVSSWWSVTETAWLALDDPLPALTAVGRVGAKVVRRRVLGGRTRRVDRRFRPAPPRFLAGRAARRAAGTS